KITDNVKSIYSKNNLHFIIKNDNSLWVWGHFYKGIFNEDVSSISLPYKLMDDVKSINIEDGNNSSIHIIKQDNSLWAMGRNEDTQLGDGTKTNRFNPVKIMDEVESVGNYTLLKKDGSLWQWGKYNGSNSPVKVID
ncbi:MAG: hypothetical protein Q8942_11365, partial [Bacillota bacterium]|nr:hypothetical protein [Bacillota bacterium]